MYPEFIDENQKSHWTAEEIFVHNQVDWIHTFIQHDYNIGMHTQGFFEINIVLKGKGRHYIAKRNLEVGQGDTFIIPPNIRHGYLGEKGFDVYHVLIHQHFLEKYIADLQPLPFFYALFNIEPLMRMSGREPLHLKIEETQFERVESLIESLIKWSKPEDAVTAVMCNSSAVMLIAQLCSIYSENHLAGERNKQGGCDEAFMQSIALIYKKYYEKITIERLAKIAGLSRTAYIALFKRIMGMPPASFVVNRRLEVAKSMLSNTELTVSDIAEKTGFYDAAHFIRCLIRNEGCSPLEYKNAQRYLRIKNESS